MKGLLRGYYSIIGVLSTLPITEVNRVSLDITNSNHSWSQSGANLHKDLGVLVVGNSLHNGTSTSFWVGRFENSTSNEHSIHTKLHHECSIGGCGNTPGSKVNNGESSIVGNKLDKFVWGLELLGSNEEFILGHDRQSLNFRLDSSGMTDGLNNVT